MSNVYDQRFFAAVFAILTRSPVAESKIALAICVKSRRLLARLGMPPTLTCAGRGVKFSEIQTEPLPGKRLRTPVVYTIVTLQQPSLWHGPN